MIDRAIRTLANGRKTVVTADDAARDHMPRELYLNIGDERPLRLHICHPPMRNHFENEPRWEGRTR